MGIAAAGCREEARSSGAGLSLDVPAVPPPKSSAPSQPGKGTDADAVSPSTPNDHASRARVGMEGAAGDTKPDGSAVQPSTDAGAAPSEAAHPAKELCRARIPLAGTHGDKTIGTIYQTWVATSHAYVATDADGNIVISGTFVGAIDLGAGLLSDNDADWAMYVAKFDRDCQPLWSHVYGLPGTQGESGARVEGGPISVAPDGEIVIGGTLFNRADFGTGVVASTPGEDNGFWIKLRADGTTRFVKLYNGDENSFVYGLGVDGDGDVVVTGFVWSDPDFGVTLAQDGATMAKYSGDGDPIWIRKLAPVTERVQLRIASDGALWISGDANRPLDWADGTAPLVPDPDMAITWLSQLAPDGTHRWSTEIAHAAMGWGVDWALEPSGTALVTYGAQSMPETGSVVRAIDAIAGKGAVYSHATWNSSADLEGWDLATDSNANAIEIGITGKALAVGDSTYPPLGGQDVYVAKHDRAGQLIWAAQEGTDRNDQALGVTTDADDNTVALWFSTDASYQTSDELVLVKLAP